MGNRRDGAYLWKLSGCHELVMNPDFHMFCGLADLRRTIVWHLWLGLNGYIPSKLGRKIENRKKTSYIFDTLFK